MKIGIDFHSAKRQGSGNCTYIRNLVENLLKLDSSNEYYLYITDRNYPYYKKFEKLEKVFLRLIRPGIPFIRIPFLGIRTFIDQLDLILVQYIAPPFFRGKLVVVVHDVSFLYFPECFKKSEQIHLKALIPRNLKKAEKIITGSEYSKKDITENYGITADKIEVIYDGVNSFFRKLEQVTKKNIVQKYSIKERFILFVGRLDARKNVLGLAKAFISLKKHKSIPHLLVIVGKKYFLPEENEIINISKERKDIIFTGYVDEDELVKLYNRADVFVYPSLYEGFGLPCLEAMACGCPVVSSNVSSIPEVVGDAGILIDPQNIEELTDAIYRVISDKQLRKSMISKGLKRAKKFTWEKTAWKTLTVFNKVLND